MRRRHDHANTLQQSLQAEQICWTTQKIDRRDHRLCVPKAVKLWPVELPMVVLLLLPFADGWVPFINFQEAGDGSVLLLVPVDMGTDSVRC